MTTLRRELIQIIKKYFNEREPLPAHAEAWGGSRYHISDKEAEGLADAVLELRAFNKDKIEARRLNKEEKEEILSKAEIMWSVLGNTQVKQSSLDEVNLEFRAMDEFEKDMACPKNWNWYPAKSSEESAWKILREFVVEKYKENPLAFQEYQTWRTQPYARGAMSNLAIKRNPENFPASWSDFLASNAMYGKKENKRVNTDESGTPRTY